MLLAFIEYLFFHPFVILSVSCALLWVCLFVLFFSLKKNLWGAGNEFKDADAEVRIASGSQRSPFSVGLRG